MRDGSSYRAARRNHMRYLGTIREWRKGPFHAVAFNENKRREGGIVHASLTEKFTPATRT